MNHESRDFAKVRNQTSFLLCRFLIVHIFQMESGYLKSEEYLLVVVNRNNGQVKNSSISEEKVAKNHNKKWKGNNPGNPSNRHLNYYRMDPARPSDNKNNT